MERLMGRPARTPRGRRRRADARWAVWLALAFAGVTTVLDWASGGLTVARADLWALLAVAAFTALRPPRVTAGGGRLTVRGLVRVRRVRIDALVGVWRDGRIATHLLLWDVYGHRVTLDLGVLVADPLLWHELDTGARRSLEAGTLRHGAEILRLLGRNLDDTATRGILGASGLE
ncbi:hypothetical protein [Streptomyces iranensis]|uniref:Integral membrane protein n=2 Tax=Streptomyces iranensis TaxID=576784 RepID=A0ABS4MX59_9ACTN|nr:hypothetical protein [Streptomyces iranensis]MBP2064314.1 hypothetical protein [Streptomyces iranensis]